MRLKILKTLLACFAVSMLVACGGKDETKENSKNGEKVEKEEKDEEKDDSSEANGDWNKDDFSIYDSTGKLHDYPTRGALHLSYLEKGDYNYQTSRGVKLGDKAKVALKEYNLDNFIIQVSSYPVMGSLNDEQKEIGNSFLDKYPDIHDAIENMDELNKDKLSLFIMGYFRVDGDKMIPMSSGKKSFPDNEEIDPPFEKYAISFRIVKGEIVNISFENGVEEEE